MRKATGSLDHPKARNYSTSPRLFNAIRQHYEWQKIRERYPLMALDTLLILYGRAGCGKELMTTESLKAIGVPPCKIHLSKLVNNRDPTYNLISAYCQAATEDYAALLLVDDLDPGTEYQELNEFVRCLTSLAKNPFQISPLFTSLAYTVPIQNPPTIFLTNDNTKLPSEYRRLIDKGHLRCFYWSPTPRETVEILVNIFPASTLREVEILVSVFPNKPISFFKAIAKRASCQKREKTVKEPHSLKNLIDIGRHSK